MKMMRTRKGWKNDANESKGRDGEKGENDDEASSWPWPSLYWSPRPVSLLYTTRCAAPSLTNVRMSDFHNACVCVWLYVVAMHILIHTSRVA